MTGPIAPGWYPDPQIPNTMRWWNGDRWTGATRPAGIGPDRTFPSASPVSGSPVSDDNVTNSAPPVSPAPEKSSKKKTLLVVVLGVVAALWFVGTQSGDDEGNVTASSTSTTTFTYDAETAAARATAAAESARAAAESRAAAASRSAEASAAAVAALLDKSTYQSVDERTWQLVTKDPDAHVGQKYVVYGHVVQADTVTGPNRIRVNTSGAQVRYYNMDINTIASTGHASFANVVQGDLVTMWVVVTGSMSYDTTFGGSLTAPTVDVNIIETYGTS